MTITNKDNIKLEIENHIIERNALATFYIIEKWLNDKTVMQRIDLFNPPIFAGFLVSIKFETRNEFKEHYGYFMNNDSYNGFRIIKPRINLNHNEISFVALSNHNKT